MRDLNLSLLSILMSNTSINTMATQHGGFWLVLLLLNRHNFINGIPPFALKVLLFSIKIELALLGEKS